MPLAFFNWAAAADTPDRVKDTDVGGYHNQLRDDGTVYDSQTKHAVGESTAAEGQGKTVKVQQKVKERRQRTPRRATPAVWQLRNSEMILM